jgi:hypothetical protein
VFESTWPKLAQGVQELIDTLDQHSHTEDHARRIMDRLLLECQFCPTPAQIQATATMEPAFTKAPKGCSQCNGSGWLSVKKMRRCPDGSSGSGKLVEMWGAALCICERGRYFAAISLTRSRSATLQ